jgi:hypothetical protein
MTQALIRPEGLIYMAVLPIIEWGSTQEEGERDRSPNWFTSSFTSRRRSLVEAVALARPEPYTKHTSDWYNSWATPLWRGKG